MSKKGAPFGNHNAKGHHMNFKLMRVGETAKYYSDLIKSSRDTSHFKALGIRVKK